MSRLALHVLAGVVCWLLEHPYAPVVFLFLVAVWAWWLAGWGASLGSDESVRPSGPPT